MTDIEKRQSEIDLLIEKALSPTPIRSRLLELARIGLNDPRDLTPIEVQQVCYGLVASFSVDE